MVRGDYNKGSSSDRCPRCSSELKAWTDLTEHEQTLALSLGSLADHPPEQRKKHRFCTRCWFESQADGLDRFA